jgi:hypothetical protein
MSDAPQETLPGGCIEPHTPHGFRRCTGFDNERIRFRFVDASQANGMSSRAPFS